MAARKKKPPPATEPPRIYQATRAPGPSGVVFKGAEIDARGNAPDEAVVQGVEESWERALQRYERRWQKIKSFYPAGVQRFDEAGICLHDAAVLHLARRGEQFVMVVKPDRPPRDLVI